jgi:hypothetical protein
VVDRIRQPKRANFRGLNVNLAPDALLDGKYPLALNIRAEGDSFIRTRPGYGTTPPSGVTGSGFSTGGLRITDISSYMTLGSAQPRTIVHDSGGGVWLDDGVKKGTVGFGGIGASMITFRPSSSPQSWMYVANGTGYDKFEAPDLLNNVITQKVGIAEPQAPPDSCPDGFQYNEFAQFANWTHTGSAGAVVGPLLITNITAAVAAVVTTSPNHGLSSGNTVLIQGSNSTPSIDGLRVVTVLSVNTFSVAVNTSVSGSAGVATPQNPVDVVRSNDSVVAIFKDPASVSPATKIRYSVQVGTSVTYQAQETLTFNKSGGGVFSAVVEDVYPPINGGTALTIQAIYYFTGTTGNCIIVPSQLPTGGLISDNGENQPQTINLPVLSGQVSALRRGSLVTLNNGGANQETVFVLNSTVGPQMQIAFECSTLNTHVATEAINGVPAICVSGITSAIVGQTAAAVQTNSVISKGIGYLTQTLATNPFSLDLGTVGVPQEDDLIHISLTTDVPTNVVELDIMFDVGDGTFNGNFLYFSISSNALQGITVSQTQSGATQAALQDVTFNQAVANLYQYYGNQIVTLNVNPDGTITVKLKSGATLTFGNTDASGVGQYTEVTFSIGSLIRIGNDQTKSLATCNAVRIAANVTGSTVLGFGSIWVGGGGQLDVGTTSSPYYYRVVPYSSATGATGNPSPSTRYGVLPRLQPNILSLPSVAYDSQIDTIDIYRLGGSVNSWRYIGTAKSSAATYVDNALDSAALGSDELQFDNFEPWPSVDVPFIAAVGGNVTSITVIGTAIIVMASGSSFPASTLRWLPGTLITLDGAYTYTLWARPQAIAGGVLFRTLENASAPTVTTMIVNEPLVANQNLPYMWGPDAGGIVYASGDPLKPGTFYSSKPNNPDSAPDTAYDLTPPSEPLLGGEIVDGLSLTASSKRWWQLQPALGTPQGFVPVETPAGRGLAAPFGHCTDGKMIYFVSTDGVYAMVPGLAAQSLTDMDLSVIFPNDGVDIGRDITYGPDSVYAPDYQYSAQFRLAIINSILRFHYFDRSGFARTLVCDLRLDTAGKPRGAWSVDVYHDSITNSYQPRQPAGTTASVASSFSQGYLSDANGKVWIELDVHNDNTTTIPAAFAVPESDGGDLRVLKEWIDGFADVVPAAANFTITPMSAGAAVAFNTSVAQGSARAQPIISVAGSSYKAYMGVLFQWTDDFSTETTWSQVYGWEMCFYPQPVLEADAVGQWDNAGFDGAKYIQGFILDADTFGAVKMVEIRNGDSLAVAQAFALQHSGEQEVAYSFTTPFIAHLVRYEGVDSTVPWKFYKMRWVWEPTPEGVLTWQTQATSHGCRGYHFVARIRFCYLSTANVILTLAVYDGTSPAAITLPSTGGAVQKVEIVPTFNKGLLFTYAGVSASNWSPMLDKCEILVGEWGRSGPYKLFQNLGSVMGDQAKI